MKILYLINSMGLGGSQLGAIMEIQELKARGYEIVIMSKGGELEEKLESIGVKHYHIDIPIASGITIPKNKNDIIKNNLINLLKYVKGNRLIKSLLKVMFVIEEEKIDIIYACQPVPVQLAYLASFFKKIPYVIRIQHILLNEFPPIGVKQVIKNASGISVITPEIKDFLINFYKVDERIDVIPTAIDFSKLIEEDNGSLKYIRKDILENYKDKIIITSLTTHRKDKIEPVLCLLEAIDELALNNNIMCILIGDGDLQNEVIRRANIINEKHYKDVVFPIGRIMNVTPYLKISDICMGVGRSAMEILLTKNLLICASHQSYGGIFTEENAQEIARYNFSGRNSMEFITKEKLINDINKFLNMSTLEKKALQLYGERFIAENYSLNKIIDDTERLFLEYYDKNRRKKCEIEI